MASRDVAEFNSATEMRDFEAANHNDFKDNAIAMAKIAEMNEDIDALTDSGADLVSAVGTRSDATVDKKAAKAALEELVRNIAGNAKVIKKEDPTFDNIFKLPRSTNFSYQKLIEIAEAFKENLTGATLAKFTAMGVSADIVTMLDSRISDYHAAVAQQNAGKSGGVQATGQTRATMTRLKKNRRTLKQIGINLYINNPAKLAAWKSACKLKKPDAPPDPTPPV